MDARAKALDLLQNRLNFTRYDVHVVGRNAEEAITEAIELFNSTDEELQEDDGLRSSLCRQILIYLVYFWRDHDRALPLADKYISIITTSYQPDPLDYAEAYNLIASCYAIDTAYSEDRYANMALDTANEAAILRTDTSTTQRMIMIKALTYRLLAISASRQDNFQAAHRLLQNTINLLTPYESTTPEVLLDLAESYHTLGNMHCLKSAKKDCFESIKEGLENFNIADNLLSRFAIYSRRHHPLSYRNKAFQGYANGRLHLYTESSRLLHEARAAFIDCYNSETQVDVKATLTLINKNAKPTCSPHNTTRAQKQIDAIENKLSALVSISDYLKQQRTIDLIPRPSTPKPKRISTQTTHSVKHHEVFKRNAEVRRAFCLFQHCTTPYLHQKSYVRMVQQEDEIRKKQQLELNEKVATAVVKKR